VDSEDKAKTIRMFSFAGPYMRAFHLNWFSFMLTFISTFAPAVSNCTQRTRAVLLPQQQYCCGTATTAVLLWNCQSLMG